jgi:hypothetical protein
MTKLIPILLEGKSWIQLSQLSLDQAHSLKSWLPVNGLKRITFQGLTLHDCVDFVTYECWFRSQMVGNIKRVSLDF